MYKVIGGDLKQYGPISADDLRKWIAEGRLNGQSLAQSVGDIEWRALSTFPEFADALEIKSHAPPPAPVAAAPSAAPVDWSARDYQLDIGGCIGRGWDVFKENFGVLFVSALIFLLIEGFIAGLGSIPFIGPIFSIANLIIAGPLLGGLYYVFIRTIRQEPATAGDIFSGFQRSFLHLFLGHIVRGLLVSLCLIPFIIVIIICVLRMAATAPGPSPDPEAVAHALVGQLAILIPVFVICMIPAIYLQVNWAFTLPLIVDRQMDFWTAMKTSWRMVSKHWWHTFGLVILIGLINMVGLALCCIGMLFSAPIGYAALMEAYETIFSSVPRQTA